MRSLALQLSFADLELQFQGVHLDPILQAISEFLDQHLTLIEQVRKDLERGLKNARTGRNGIAPSQVPLPWRKRRAKSRAHSGIATQTW